MRRRRPQRGRARTGRPCKKRRLVVQGGEARRADDSGVTGSDSAAMDVPGGRRSLASATREQLSDLADDAQTTVMEHTYDNVFEPWDTPRVCAAISQLVQLTRETDGGVEAVAGRVASVFELSEFARLHPIMAARLMRREVVNDPEQMRVLRFLVDTQRRVQGGQISGEVARADVSGFALRSLEKQAAHARADGGERAGGGGGGRR